jgi:hypothetical protein
VLAVIVAAASVRGVALADGCPPTTCGITGNTVPGSNLLVVRSGGQRGSLTAYDLARRGHRVVLPPGMLSADGRTFVVARTFHGRTTVRRFDATTGSFESTSTVGGRWHLVAVSVDGRRIALTSWDRSRRRTRFFVPGRGRFVRPGSYDVETLSRDGRVLFLVHWKANGYELQRYDLRTRTLRANPPREGAEGKTEKMSGAAWTAAATRNGRWLLTLYLKPDGTAFVHALDLTGGPPHCIDLPGRGANAFLSSALALSPRERVLYVATPALGQIVRVDLARLRVARTVHFRTFTHDPVVGAGPNAAVSSDGRTLAFSNGAWVWRYDTVRARVRFAATMENDVMALGFGPHERLTALVGSTLEVVR